MPLGGYPTAVLVTAGLEAEMTAAGLPLHPRTLGLECLEVGPFGLDLGPQGLCTSIEHSTTTAESHHKVRHNHGRYDAKTQHVRCISAPETPPNPRHYAGGKFRREVTDHCTFGASGHESALTRPGAVLAARNGSNPERVCPSALTFAGAPNCTPWGAIAALVSLSENVGYAREHEQALDGLVTGAPGGAWPGSDESLDQGRGPRGVHRGGCAVQAAGRGAGPGAAARQETPGVRQSVVPAGGTAEAARGSPEARRKAIGTQTGDCPALSADLPHQAARPPPQCDEGGWVVLRQTHRHLDR
ncbi:Hypothetical protein APM_0355 (plasmid) [Acidiphilium sp. PM]|nr:Hypothetical protein APM_0355 [Acidiphilium sp. PM]